MSASAGPRVASSGSAAASPSSSRQRRRRTPRLGVASSASSAASSAAGHRASPAAGRRWPRRGAARTGVDGLVAAPCRIRLGRLQAFGDRPALGGAEGAEGPADQGQHVDELARRSARRPSCRAGRAARRRGSAAARRRRRTLHPGGLGGRRRHRRRGRGATGRRASASRSASKQDADHPAGDLGGAIRSAARTAAGCPASRPWPQVADRSGAGRRVRRLIAGAEQVDGGVHGVDALAHRAGVLGVEPDQRRSQAGADPDHQRLADLAEGRGVGAADVAVALRSRQRRQRLHQVHHVGVEGGPLGHRGQQLLQGVGQVGEQAASPRPRSARPDRASRRRRGSWRSPPPRPWCPRSRPPPARPRTPAATGTARSPGTCRGSPPRSRRAGSSQAEHPQPVEQHRSGAVGRFAQIQVVRFRVRVPLDPQGAALLQQVRLQRHRRNVGVDAAQRLPDHEL